MFKAIGKKSKRIQHNAIDRAPESNVAEFSDIFASEIKTTVISGAKLRFDRKGVIQCSVEVQKVTLPSKFSWSIIRLTLSITILFIDAKFSYFPSMFLLLCSAFPSPALSSGLG